MPYSHRNRTRLAAAIDVVNMDTGQINVHSQDLLSTIVDEDEVKAVERETAVAGEAAASPPA